MATTKIWPIHGDISKVLRYVGNEEKTMNIMYNSAEMEALKDVMDYAVNPSKTEMQYYVSGVNCDPAIARQQMITTKKRFGKMDKRCAYHAYQSFKPGEVTPELAHEIGVKLAREIWGERYQVVVATHLDRKHYHNHFVLNSVSFVDGKKFRDNFKDYYGNMRSVSDRLCKEYGLSVVEAPEPGRSKHYSEWDADQRGQPTWRGLIRQDVDEAIRRSMTFTQFIQNLKDMGYEVKTNVKHIAVRPQDKERFVRLRSLGEEYTEESIKNLIINQKSPQRKPPMLVPRVKKAKYHGSFTSHKPIKLKGLRALYFHYLYRLGVIKKRCASPKRAAFLLREDIRKMKSLFAQARLLNAHRIDTLDQLRAYRDSVRQQMEDLYAERNSLYKEKRHTGLNEETARALDSKTAQVSARLKTLRKEVKLCNEVEVRSVTIRETLEQVREHKKEVREQKNHEQWRSR
ncbi:MAG: relaxase/mobilization nuclease domain-containing protein [Bacillota bacterium]